MFSSSAARVGSSCRALQLTSLSQRVHLSTFALGGTRPALEFPASSPSNERLFSSQAERGQQRPRKTYGSERRSDGARPSEDMSDAPRHVRRDRMRAELVDKYRKRSPLVAPAGEEKKLLDPYTLAQRLRKLCEENKIDDAVTMLKNVPRDAMNTPVWNTMIWEALKIQRFQLAHSLYVDMKRRGFSPSTRTFQTLFSGLSRIERWNTYTKQLENARGIYDDFHKHITSLKKHDAYSPDITPDPLAGYIKILGNAGQYQEIFDVYYSLDPDGPFSANAIIYTSVLQALAQLKTTLRNQGITAPDSWGPKVASDARLIWNSVLKASGDNLPGIIDTPLATAAISALSQGALADHELAFEIVRDFFGLSKDIASKKRGHFPLTRQALGATLRLCNDAKEPALAVHFFQLVKRSNTSHIIDRLHVEEVIRARYHLSPGGMGIAAVQLLEWMLEAEKRGASGMQLRPALSTYNLVLSSCWKAGDYSSAMTAFELMTGHHPEDFTDSAVAAGKTPRYTKRPEGRNAFPSAEALSMMMRTAVASKSRPHMRACLRLVDHIGLDIVLPQRSERASDTTRALKNQNFYASKLADAVEDAWNAVKGYGNEAGEQELARWRSMVEKTRKYSRSKSEVAKPTPLLE